MNNIEQYKDAVGINEAYNKPTLMLAMVCGIAAWVMSMVQAHKEREPVKYIPLRRFKERRRAA